jgi:hypothetical protein
MYQAGGTIKDLLTKVDAYSGEVEQPFRPT